MRIKILFIISVFLLIGCASGKNIMSCKTDADCACGTNKETGDCFYGNKKYVNTANQCPDFCSGYDGKLIIKCIDNECTQLRGEETKKECITDADCVKDSCCHATGCIIKYEAPDCKEVFCTMDCQPGTLDCGQGACKCDDGECVAEFY